LVEREVELVVQVNGKLREKIRVEKDAAEDQVLAAAQASERVTAALEGKSVVKTVVVPGKLVNFVVR
jgi:leucyl-tRNA synthetase